jgi:class 3 adenylate cyclase
VAETNQSPAGLDGTDGTHANGGRDVPWRRLRLSARLGDASRVEGFSTHLYELSSSRGRKFLYFALLVLALSFLSFDYANYLTGNWDVHRGIFRKVFVWRCWATITAAALLVLHMALDGPGHPAFRRWFSWSLVLVLLAVGVSFGIICQYLMADLSIFAFGVFVVAGLFPLPHLLKLALYPIACILVLAGVRVVGFDPLAWRGLVINAVSVTSMAMLIDFLCVESEIKTYVAERTIERERLQSETLQRNVQRLLGRYIPSQLAEEIIKGEHVEEFKPTRTRLTVFFSDIEGFTQASDHLDPEDLAGLLNEYLSEMVGIAERYGATINQIVGDGIMAFFGAPTATTDREHALNAVRMSQAMQRRMAELKGIWEQRGIQKPFRIRIGLNTGYASVGDYGSAGRKLYSAIGLQTNLAARIQAHCEPGRILVSNTTWALIKDQVPCIEKGELPLKGVHYPVPVFEVAQAP